ncbi:MAG TPA: helix-turn-helix transcriptional regulator [Mycobacteriales bacterium]|nr:helix-turn-helix transcriptional regulator [Mycobacteriales bacterium]
MRTAPTDWRNALGAQLRRYRHQQHLSQRGLARELGLPHSTVTRLEAGEHEPRISTLRRIADVLGDKLELHIEPGTTQLTVRQQPRNRDD